VVVNDVDADLDGVTDGNDISTEAGAAALIDAALSEFGRIDVLVNNAGIMRWGGLPDLDPDDFERLVAVHLTGSFLTVRAAWPHMVDAGYGRIVNTTSAGVFGLANNTAYAAAKGGVIGLTRSLAVAGAEHGIKVNAIAPAAMTRMAGPGAEDDDGPMAADLAAPMVAYLAHEDCPVTGEIYAAGAGRFSRVFIATTPGYVHDGCPTIEDVAHHWDAINDESAYAVPSDLMSWSATVTEHLEQ
jgi:NAD(P)-dependent dehydrogenase (short-subunit alcohol dehydrogenase family)